MKMWVLFCGKSQKYWPQHKYFGFKTTTYFRSQNHHCPSGQMHTQSQQNNIRATFSNVALMLFYWLWTGDCPLGCGYQAWDFSGNCRNSGIFVDFVRNFLFRNSYILTRAIFIFVYTVILLLVWCWKGIFRRSRACKTQIKSPRRLHRDTKLSKKLSGSFQT